MTITAYPDVLGGLFWYLRIPAQITALTGDRIADEVKPEWSFAAKKAKYAIVIPGRRGTPVETDDPIGRWRFDVIVYGPNKLAAATLMNLVLGYLCPKDGQRNGFTAPHVHVNWIAVEGGPNDLIEPDTDWTFSLASIHVDFDGVPY